MKIAHLSDIHCDSTPGNRKALRRLFTSVDRKNPDHIVITGDLTESGDDDEYSVLNELFDKFGWNDSTKLTVIPGNHDAFPELFGEVDWEEQIRSVAGLISLSRSIPKLLQSHQGYKPSDYRRSISRFTEAFSNTFHSSTKLGSKESPFPMIKVLKDEIALICFDSNDVYPTVRKSVGGILKEFTMNGIYWITAAQNLSENPVCCNGWIEKGGLKKVLSDPILKGKKKIVLTHHYLYDLETVMAYQNTAFSNFMQMYPSSLNYFVSQLEKKDIDLVLHGHWHITESYRCGSLQVLNSGGSLSNANRNYRGWFLITTGAGKPIAKRINVA